MVIVFRLSNIGDIRITELSRCGFKTGERSGGRKNRWTWRWTPIDSILCRLEVCSHDTRRILVSTDCRSLLSSTPSRSLLSGHTMYPAAVGSLVGLRSLMQQRSLVNHVPSFLDAAAFSRGNVPQDAGAVGPSSHDDDETGSSPVNLCSTAVDNSQTRQLLIGDTLTRSWSPFTRNESTHVGDPGVGVYQRLLAFMSRRASYLDSIQKRNVQHAFFGGRPYPRLDSPAIISLNVSRTPECSSESV